MHTPLVYFGIVQCIAQPACALHSPLVHFSVFLCVALKYTRQMFISEVPGALHWPLVQRTKKHGNAQEGSAVHSTAIALCALHSRVVQCTARLCNALPGCAMH